MQGFFVLQPLCFTRPCQVVLKLPALLVLHQLISVSLQEPKGTPRYLAYSLCSGS